MEKWLEKFMALSIGEKIIIIAGLLLFIDGFLPWYDVDLGPFGSVTRNGWESPGAWCPGLMICGAIAQPPRSPLRMGRPQLSGYLGGPHTGQHGGARSASEWEGEMRVGRGRPSPDEVP